MKTQEMLAVLDAEPIEAEDVVWKYYNSLAEKKQYNTLLVSVCGKFTCEQVTKRSECGFETIGKMKSYYFIVGDDKREFKTVEALVEAYNEKLIWEQNNLLKEGFRVEWKRVIVKDGEESNITIIAKQGEPVGIKVLKNERFFEKPVLTQGG